MIRPIATACLLLLAGLCGWSTALAAGEPERLPLWGGSAPIDDGAVEKAEVWITVHRPATPNGQAIVICPGGGYGMLVTGPEGHGIAKWLNGHGITGVVLEYRLPKGRPYVPLLDAQRALRTVRARAQDWGISAAKVGMIGFSAGGHLVTAAGTHFDDGDAASADPIARLGCRPDFVLAVYPVVNMGPATHAQCRRNLLGDNPSPELVALFSNELQVTARTPPTFLVHALDDKVVPPIHSQQLFKALGEHQVAHSEYLELPSGGHGLNGYKGPRWDAWQARAIAWLGELP